MQERETETFSRSNFHCPLQSLQCPEIAYALKCINAPDSPPTQWTPLASFPGHTGTFKEAGERRTAPPHTRGVKTDILDVLDIRKCTLTLKPCNV